VPDLCTRQRLCGGRMRLRRRELRDRMLLFGLMRHSHVRRVRDRGRRMHGVSAWAGVQRWRGMRMRLCIVSRRMLQRQRVRCLRGPDGHGMRRWRWGVCGMRRRTDVRHRRDLRLQREFVPQRMLRWKHVRRHFQAVCDAVWCGRQCVWFVHCGQFVQRWGLRVRRRELHRVLQRRPMPCAVRRGVRDGRNHLLEMHFDSGVPRGRVRLRRRFVSKRMLRRQRSLPRV